MSETQTPVDEDFMRKFKEMERKIADISNSAISGQFATGMLAASAAATHTGFLLCDGSLVSRTTYGGLFGVIGTTYGVGDGSTTFAIPDYRGYVLGGVGGSLPTLGVPVGASAVTLTAPESGQPGIAAGTSGSTTPGSTGAGTAHSHGSPGNPFVTAANGGGQGFAGGTLVTNTTAVTSTEAAHTHPSAAHTHTTPAVAAAPASAAHTNLQPTLPAFVHIKT